MGDKDRPGSNGRSYAAAAPTVAVWTEEGAATQKRFVVGELSGTLAINGKEIVAQVGINGNTYNGSSTYAWRALREALRMAAQEHPEINDYGSIGALARSISKQSSYEDDPSATGSLPTMNSTVMPPPASSLEGRMRETDDSWRLRFTPEEPGYGHGV